MKKSNKFLIITGGTLCINFLRTHLNQNIYDKIICVDGGLEVAHQLGVKMDYIVGDFDSVEEKTIDVYRKAAKEKKVSFQLLEYNPVKDATDTQIAIELALEYEANAITILGGTGTRIDHLIGNINLLMKPLEKKVTACIIDEYNKIYLAKESFALKKQEVYGSYISLLPLTEKVEGVTLIGMKYPLSHHTLTIGDSLGISNEIIEEHGKILFDTGILIVIEAADKPQ